MNHPNFSSSAWPCQGTRSYSDRVFVDWQTVEAAKECGMASVVVAGRKPLYELKAADLVVKKLSELRVINLQQLFRNEELVNGNVSICCRESLPSVLP